MSYTELDHEHEAFPVIVLPKKRLWKLYSRVGSLRDVEEIYRILDEAGLRRVHMELKENPGSYDAYAVVDASEAREDCKTVSLKLSSRRGILEVEVAESEVQGIEVLGLLERRTSDTIMMRAKCFAMILNILKRLWGTAGKFISYTVGVEVGREHYQWLQRLAGEELKGRSFLEAALHIGAELGWWERTCLEAFDAGRGVMVVKLYGCVECKYAQEAMPNADFFRGFLGSLTSELMGGEFEVEESACIAKGDSHCLIRAWRR